MTLPVLTWNLVGPQVIRSGSVVLGPGSLRPKSHVMHTLRELVRSSSYWQVDVQDMTGSATEALVLRPNPALSATPNMRIIATMNVSGALGGAPTAQTMQDTSKDVADTFVANMFLLGFSPDISASPTWVTGSWNSDRPWGPNVRWSKYWGGGLLGSLTTIDQMYLIESSEILWIGLKGRRGNSAFFGIGAGAIIESLTDASGETDRRVYGMTCINTVSMSTTWWLASSNAPFGQVGTANNGHTGVFIVSGGVANGPTPSGAANSNTWEHVMKGWDGNPFGPSDGGRSSTLTVEENLALVPIPMTSSQAPIRMVGHLRQMYYSNEFLGLMTVVTGTGPVFTPAGVFMGADNQASSDGIFFGNIV